jgi:hypothetical protein
MTKRILFFLILMVALNSGAQTIYVSTLGNDANPGTKEEPVSTFAKAQELVRKLPKEALVKVLFAPGVYYLPEIISFTEADTKVSAIYQAEEEGRAIISGGTLLHLEWKLWKNSIFVAKVEGNPLIDQLYINGKRQRMARFPNAVAGKNVFDTWDLSHNAQPDAANNPLSPERIARWKNPEGGYIHAMHSALWGDMHWLIKGKNADGTLNYEGGWQNNRPSEMHPVYRMVENIFEELDAPGEWFFNRKEQQLYFMPEPDVNLKTATVEIVRLRHLIEFNGSKENPVKNVHLKGFVFRHAARPFMENKEPLLRSDWTVYRGGALVFSGVEDCSIVDCEFDQVGGNTIFVNNYNRRISIRGCYIHHSGANGIAFVGDPEAVRSPIFRYGPQNFSAMDSTPGPKNDNYPSDCLVEDCLITMTGRDEKQTAPIQISMSHKIRVNHCSIYDVPRAGININEGTFGGHIIENCDVFNTVLETGDHGSFNSWGRDRFWTPDINQTVPEVAQNPDLPFLDMLEPNIIRNSRWRCDHGWDIDLDDGSSWYCIYNNLLLNGGLKMREGYNRQATNNVIVNNSLHPHVWYPNSGDVFKNNIVFTAYRPAVMDRGIAPNGKWGKELDFNFFAATAVEMNKFAQNGCDANSSFGDPLFEKPEKGDFRVKESSPVLKKGFVNFPMNQFGVTKPALKAIAKTPVIPAISIKISQGESSSVNRSILWAGAKLSEPVGDELSAYGAAFADGGVAIMQLDESSILKKYGLKAGDLIQKINASKIKNTTELKTYLEANQKVTNHTFSILRNQQKNEIKVNQILPVMDKN